MFNSIGRCQVHLTAAENMVIGFYWRITPETEPSAITGCGIMALHEKSPPYFCAAFLFFVPNFFTDHSACERERLVSHQSEKHKKTQSDVGPLGQRERELASLPPSLIHYLIKLPILSFPHTHTPLPIYNTRQRAFSCITPIQEKKTLKRL